MNLIEIYQRISQATEPDREIDAHVHCVKEGLEFVLLATGDEAYGDICDPSDRGYGTGNRCTSGMLYARYPDSKNPPTLGGGKRGNKVQGCTPPRYSASLDEVVKLVPDGWSWVVGSGDEYIAVNYPRAAASAKCQGPEDGQFIYHQGHTPALALLGAAFGALVAMEVSK